MPRELRAGGGHPRPGHRAPQLRRRRDGGFRHRVRDHARQGGGLRRWGEATHRRRRRGVVRLSQVVVEALHLRVQPGYRVGEPGQGRLRAGSSGCHRRGLVGAPLPSCRVRQDDDQKYLRRPHRSGKRRTGEHRPRSTPGADQDLDTAVLGAPAAVSLEAREQFRRKPRSRSARSRPGREEIGHRLRPASRKLSVRPRTAHRVGVAADDDGSAGESFSDVPGHVVHDHQRAGAKHGLTAVKEQVGGEGVQRRAGSALHLDFPPRRGGGSGRGGGNRGGGSCSRCRRGLAEMS